MESWPCTDRSSCVCIGEATLTAVQRLTTSNIHSLKLLHKEATVSSVSRTEQREVYEPRARFRTREVPNVWFLLCPAKLHPPYWCHTLSPVHYGKYPVFWERKRGLRSHTHGIHIPYTHNKYRTQYMHTTQSGALDGWTSVLSELSKLIPPHLLSSKTLTYHPSILVDGKVLSCRHIAIPRWSKLPACSTYENLAARVLQSHSLLCAYLATLPALQLQHTGISTFQSQPPCF